MLTFPVFTYHENSAARDVMTSVQKHFECSFLSSYHAESMGVLKGVKKTTKSSNSNFLFSFDLREKVQQNTPVMKWCLLLK